jgi:uncharacterized membrane protein YgdD (TMEM256/DUF423 family)
MNWPATGAILLALGVILGAFGAHGLRDRLASMGTAEIYQKAVFYHFVHALGVLIVGILPKTGTFPESGADAVCILLLIGIIVFSGSLYLLAVTGRTMLGAITPIGGVAFIAAWVLLAWRLRRGI